MTYQKTRYMVNGLEMAVIEYGDGDPIVFLHGNPTSSYLWRKVMPHVEGRGRLIAPDLIGMGDSDRLPESGPGRYRFVEHRQYLDRLLEQLDVRDNVTMVIHDWGSALGFDWAHRHANVMKGIAYMEGIVKPIPLEDWPDQSRRAFLGMRSEGGEEMVLGKNFFVEKLLPHAILRDLTDEEMSEYRRPFLEPGESRRPTLTWPREIPLGGEPEDVVRIVDDYARWLETATVPKLFINAEPGAILIGRQREYCRSWPHQTEVTVKGHHFVQEDSPHEIGQAIAGWLDGLV